MDQLPKGLRVLLVEDEALIAMDLEATLLAAGCEVIGPAARLDKALHLAATEALDGALLDVNLAGEMSFPVAEMLKARGIPFVLSTAYHALRLPPFLQTAHMLRKPFRADGALTALAAALEASGRRVTAS